MPPGPAPVPIDRAAEARRLADLFDSLSQAIDDYRQSDKVPPNTLPADLAKLKTMAQSLEDLANHFTAEAIGATLQSIQPDLARIKAVTLDAKAQLGVLKSVSKVISIATAGLSLGTAIATGNPVSIASAVEALGQAVVA